MRIESSKTTSSAIQEKGMGPEASTETQTGIELAAATATLKDAATASPLNTTTSPKVKSLPLLDRSFLENAPGHIEVPRYNRDNMEVSVVALGGLSHLNRGLIAPLFHQVMQEDEANHENPRYGIASISLQSKEPAENMAKQDSLYTVTECNGTGGVANYSTAVIGSVKECLYAPEHREAVLNYLTAPSTKMVTLTITRAGYHVVGSMGDQLNPAGLNFEDPAIAKDLSNPSAPSTAPGYLAWGIEMRRQAGLPPFLVLSCDNYPPNGEYARRVVLDYAAKLDHSGKTSGLYNYIVNTMSDHFPVTMVDRLVPKKWIGPPIADEQLGAVQDEPIYTEPLASWVIEQTPLVEELIPQTKGIALTPYPQQVARVKDTMVNGLHVIGTQEGKFRGIKFIHEIFNHPELAPMLETAAAVELAGSIHPTDLDMACDGEKPKHQEPLERFANIALPDPTTRVADEGFPDRLKRIVDVAIRSLDMEASNPTSEGPPSLDATYNAIAAWAIMHTLEVGYYWQPVTWKEKDPATTVIRNARASVDFDRLIQKATSPAEYANAVCRVWDHWVQIDKCLGSDTPGNAAFRNAVHEKIHSRVLTAWTLRNELKQKTQDNSPSDLIH